MEFSQIHWWRELRHYPSVGLADYLQSRYGMYLNGVILISAVLDFGADATDRGNDRPFPLMLPTFSATAWYHKKLSPQYDDLEKLLKEVETFSATKYAAALLKGDALGTDERNRIINKLHDYTGLSKEYIDASNLRLYVGRFNKELLRSEGKTVGRLDSRFTGNDYGNAGESFEYDPSWYRRVIETEIQPLLEEYWFDDPDKADNWRERLLESVP